MASSSSATTRQPRMVAPSVFDEEEFFSADSRFNRWSRYKDRDYCEIRWINSRWFIQEQFQFVGLLQNQELVYRQTLRPGFQWNRGPKRVKHMRVDNRILHYIVAYCLYPRTSWNYGQVNELDLKLLNAIINNVSVNWARIILHRMYLATGYKNNGWLPYPMHVCFLLQSFGVLIPFGDSFYAYTADEACIGSAFLHQMGMLSHPDIGIWFWKEDIQADIGNLQLGHDQNMETEDGGSNENFLSIHSNRHVDDCFLGYVNSQFDQMNNRLDGMNVHLARIDSRIDQIEQRIADNHQSIMQYLSDAFASLRFPSSG